MVDGDCKDDGLGEEDFERAGHAGGELGGEGAVVLVGRAVFVGGVGSGRGGGFFEAEFAGMEDGGAVGFFEEEEADYGVECADDC